MVTLSGIFGTYLAWSLQAKRGSTSASATITSLARRAELARQVNAAVANTNSSAAEFALPAPPYHAWIAELYTTHLRDFLQGQLILPPI